MPHIRIVGDKKIDISQEEAERINPLLLEVDPPEFIQVQGQPIKTAKIIGVFEDEILPSFQKNEFHWTEQELREWEKEVFKHNDTFRNYLIGQGIIVVNEFHPQGTIRYPEKYRIMIAKWDKLNGLRHHQEKATKFEGTKRQLAQIKVKLTKFKENVVMEKPVMASKPYKSPKEPKDGEIDVQRIPF